MMNRKENMKIISKEKNEEEKKKVEMKVSRKRN
jgi:hypothetical protein